MHRHLLKKEVPNLVFFVLGSVLLVEASTYAPMARTFPRLVLLVLLLLVSADVAGGYIRRSGSGRKDKSGRGESEGDGTAIPEAQLTSAPGTFSAIPALSSVLLLLLFPVFVLVFGFLPGSFLFIISSAWLLGYRTPWALALSSTVMTAFLYAVFVLLMNARLPRGLLFDIMTR